ncbi:MAG: LarC family nickel insertion protein [Clostridia bacterium]|nr:LarC family nickel insertion protein [Clostridia bacterium]
MNILYIDARMGVSGVKLLGALVDMMEQPDIFIRQFNELGFDGIKAEMRNSSDGNVSGSRIEFTRSDYEVDDDDDDEEESSGGFFSFGRTTKSSGHSSKRGITDRTLEDIKEIINELSLSGKARKRAINVYETIAKAAAKTHNKSINEVKLHRAAPRDVIASVVGVCMMLEDMRPEKVICSPITVGTGHVSSARGRVPVPTPTVKNILGDTPTSAGKEEGELCTLEGAALIKEYVNEFMEMPELAVLHTGVGIGARNYKSGANCLTIHVGTEVNTAANATVTELEATLFDDNAEVLRLIKDRLEAVGIIEAFAIPASRLSGGTGTILKCVCENNSADDAAKEILKYTSARLVRRTPVSAYRTDVKKETINTSLGNIEIERISGYGVAKWHLPDAEADRVARENAVSVHELREILIRAM